MATFGIEIVVLSLLVVGSTAVKESNESLSSSDSLNLIQLIVKELIQRERLAVTVEELQDKVTVLEANEVIPQERLAVKVEELQDKVRVLEAKELKQQERLAVKVGELKDKDRVLEAKLSNLTVETANNKRQIAFSGKISGRIAFTFPSPNAERIVKFDVVTTNIGNAYNTTTGIFRCPVSGLYLFSCTVLGDKIGFLTLKVLHNEVLIARPYTGVGIKWYESAADTAVVHAEAGDEIYVAEPYGTAAYIDHMSRFSGVLLKAD